MSTESEIDARSELHVIGNRLQAIIKDVQEAVDIVASAEATVSNPHELQIPPFRQTPRIGYPDMRAAIAVYDNESFTVAAKMIGMSQPGLSRMIQRLEKGVGFQIFDRKGTGAVPTRRGKFALMHFHRALASIRMLLIEEPVAFPNVVTNADGEEMDVRSGTGGG